MRSPFRPQPLWPCQPPTERSDACGASSVLVAASLIAVMAAAGVAVDYGRLYVEHTRLQNAVDSAALAGSLQLPDDPDVSNGKAAAAATANLLANDADATNIVVESGGATRSVCVSAKATVDMTISQVIGVEDQIVAAEACAGYNDIELVMVLDATGSMKGTPIANVKEAATSLVNLIMPASSDAATRSKIGLVPFQGKVRIDGNDPVAAEQNPDGKGPGCRNADDTVNNGKLKVEYSRTTTKTNIFYGYTLSGVSTSTDKTCSGMSPIRALSSNKSNILSNITALNAGAVTSGTIISEGIKWGRKVLSPEAPYVEGSTDKKVRKIMIVLTDGDTEDGRCGGNFASGSKTVNTYWTNAYFGQGLKPDTGASPYSTLSTAALTLAQIPDCKDGGLLNQYVLNEATLAKNDLNYPVEIFSIRFGDSDTTDKNLMKQIASSKAGTDDHYFDAPNEAGIQEMFKKIGQQLGQRLMTKKEATTGTP
ncbi:VWA domain-containing protein [Desulfovibrio aerotolerans]|uniref:VWA domain-containing protein n=1 Tax=Solidesulfovibrio aerotolerans TaxID=295255 RepID=A0A7C9MPB6_9BACT|nr:VWA domain-containing protein [Solidesulfovibrio aerotolerans]MYL83552.1 VWA domain-containing protein [Solidesulfovibrio aerotolerans]